MYRSSVAFFEVKALIAKAVLDLFHKGIDCVVMGYANLLDEEDLSLLTGRGLCYTVFLSDSVEIGFGDKQQLEAISKRLEDSQSQMGKIVTVECSPTYGVLNHEAPSLKTIEIWYKRGSQNMVGFDRFSVLETTMHTLKIVIEVDNIAVTDKRGLIAQSVRSLFNQGFKIVAVGNAVNYKDNFRHEVFIADGVCPDLEEDKHWDSIAEPINAFFKNDDQVKDVIFGFEAIYGWQRIKTISAAFYRSSHGSFDHSGVSIEWTLNKVVEALGLVIN